MSKRNVNYLYHELEETLRNLLELRADGYLVITNQVVASTYSKIGYLTALIYNNPDFLYKTELNDLIYKIDFFFGITRERSINEAENEK